MLHASTRDDFDLVTRGGTVALPDGPAEIDIGIKAERLAALAPGLSRGRREIDAVGQIVLPGGVDSHCHMDQPPWEGRSTADDFASGTLSTLCGGTTSVIPFAMRMRGQSLRAAPTTPPIIRPLRAGRSRGELVWNGGDIGSRPGRGRFLACDRPFAPRQDLPSVLAS